MQHLHLVIHMKLAIDRLKCVWWTVQAVRDPCVGCSRQFAVQRQVVVVNRRAGFTLDCSCECLH